MEKADLITQTRLAFDFIQKLYYEVSYFIKEVEGLLAQEQEEFMIGRSGGYAVTVQGSNGLDAQSVSLWMTKKLAVFFVPATLSEKKSEITTTRYSPKVKIIYLRFVLDDKDVPEPTLYYGVIYHITRKPPIDKYPEKIEKLIRYIEYNDSKVFQKDRLILDYEDSSISFKGRLMSQSLYDLHTSQDIVERVINPALKMFREI